MPAKHLRKPCMATPWVHRRRHGGIAADGPGDFTPPAAVVKRAARGALSRRQAQKENPGCFQSGRLTANSADP